MSGNSRGISDVDIYNANTPRFDGLTANSVRSRLECQSNNFQRLYCILFFLYTLEIYILYI